MTMLENLALLFIFVRKNCCERSIFCEFNSQAGPFLCVHILGLVCDLSHLTAPEWGKLSILDALPKF